MKILVTGSLGLVGSATQALFEKKGHSVIGIDSNMRSVFFGTESKSGAFDIDIREEGEISKLFSEHQFDAIIHTAAQPSHDWSTDHVLTDFDINARGTVVLLEATRKFCPDAVFVHVSTDKVYGENMHGETPFKEGLGLDFAGHRSFFGCSKTAADIYVQEYANEFGLKSAIFRCGCITGKNHAGAEKHGFLAYLAKCIREEKLYTIFGLKGKQVRDQIHADDLAAAFYQVVMRPRVGEVYNMGGGPERAVSVLEAITALETAIGKTAIIEYGPERPGDRVWDVHDVSKFRSHYPDWDYQYDLRDIINDLI